MKNLEKSTFRAGEYIGYRGSVVYRIRKIGGAWAASNFDNVKDRIVAVSLAAISKKLQKQGASA
jgi:hypothetical protein